MIKTKGLSEFLEVEMDIFEAAQKLVNQLDPRVVSALKKGVDMIDPRVISAVEKRVKSIPFVKRQMEKEYDAMIRELEASAKPYKDDFLAFTRLPGEGRSTETIIRDMTKLKSKEESRWKDGYVSGAVYHGDDDHVNFLTKIYALASQTNPLHSDIWPSATKYEAEVVSMTATMLGADEVAARTEPDNQICGVVSSGGTESIMLAMKTYRDWARDKKGITKPEMIVPSTVHAAFDKSSQYFNIEMIKIPVGPDYRADVAATKKAINKNTIVIVGSAPDFPHGLIDPIEELSELARKNGIGFHTDACLGGFVLPWAEKLGYDVPPFDFRLPGVTSVSADTHKYGYAPKGTSVILYRGLELRHYQYYTVTDWPGGLYFSPTFAGSRPGALSAMCWAAMISLGERGYMETCEKILRTASKIKDGISEIPEIYIIGDPLFCIAMASNSLNAYKVMDFMTKRNWNLNGLFDPRAFHICVTVRHTKEGVADKLIDDLKAAVEHVKNNPDEKGGLAPMYGLAAAIPAKGVVSDVLKRYLDLVYKV